MKAEMDLANAYAREAILVEQIKSSNLPVAATTDTIPDAG